MSHDIVNLTFHVSRFNGLVANDSTYLNQELKWYLAQTNMQISTLWY
jgi:hypothetical protein